MISDQLEQLHEIRDRYLNEDSRLAAILTDRAFRITAVNKGMLAALTIPSESDIMGTSITEYLQDEGKAALAKIRPLGSTQVNLCFHSAAGGMRVLRSTIYAHAEGYVIFGEQLQMTEDDALVKMTELMNELAGMTRRLQKQKRDLEQAQSQIKVLHGMLPICSGCKKIRDDDGYWQRLETYINERADVKFSHGMCPDCMKEYYPEVYEKHKDELT